MTRSKVEVERTRRRKKTRREAQIRKANPELAASVPRGYHVPVTPPLSPGQDPTKCRWCPAKLNSNQGRRAHEGLKHLRYKEKMPAEVPPYVPPADSLHGRPRAGSTRQRKLDQDRSEFVDLLRQGLPYGEAGERMGLARTMAYNWAKWANDHGLLSAAEAVTAAPKPRMTKGQIAEAKDDVLRGVLEGHSQDWIADQLGVKRWRVERWVADLKAEGRLTTKETVAYTDPEPIPYDQLTDEAKALLDDPIAFAKVILDLDLSPWAGMTMRDLHVRYLSGDTEYVILNAPPGIGKTTIVTFAFMVWMATIERAHGRQLAASLGHAAEDKAKWYLKRLQRTFETNRVLIETFGRFRPERSTARWSGNELDIEPLDWSALTEKEPTFSAQSYEKSQLSGRYGFIIWDDLIDKKNSSTLEQREKLQDWWENDAETRLNQGGVIVLSNARYGPEDLSFALRSMVDVEDLDEATGEPHAIYHHLAFPVHDDARCAIDANGHVTHRGDWPDHCLLDERRLSWRGLRRARAGNERRYALVYLQQDSDPVGFLAQRVWFEGGIDSKSAQAPGCFRPDLVFGRLPVGMAGGTEMTAPRLGAITIDPSSTKYWTVNHYVAWASKIHMLYRCLRRPLQAPDILYRQDDGTFTGILHEWVEAAREEGVPIDYLILENNHAQRWIMQYPFFTNYCMAQGISIIPHSTTRANKPDPDRGVEMLGPIYEHGQLWIPYGDYESKLIAEQFRKEACAYPEGSFTDLIMGHWFFTHRMEALLAAETYTTAAPSDDPRVPAFVRNRTLPPFVQKRLARMG